MTALTHLGTRIQKVRKQRGMKQQDLADQAGCGRSAVSNTWIRCHVIADDSIEGIDRTSTDPQTLTFDIRMDINGPVE